MGCKENRLKISFLLDNELPEEEANALRRHIEDCRQCARYFEHLQAARKALKLAPRVAVSGSFHKRLESRLRRHGSGAYSPPIMVRMWFRRAVAAAIAAGILIAVVLILSNTGVRNGDTSTSPEPDGRIADEDVEVPGTWMPPDEFTRQDKQKEPETPAPAPELPKREEFVKDPQRQIPKETPRVPEPEQKAPEQHAKDPEVPVEDKPKLPDVPSERPRFTEQRKPEEKPIREQQEEKKLVAKDFQRKFYGEGKRGNNEEQVAMLKQLAQASPTADTYKFFKRILSEPSKRVKPSVRREALFVLAEVGTKQAAEIMLYTYSEVDWHVSDAVPEALSRIKQRETLEWLAGKVLVSAKDAGVRRMVAEVLARLDDPVSHKLFAAALPKEPKPLVRVAICEALGASGDMDAEDALIRALDDNSWLVRDAALRALSRVGTMRCVSQAIRSLNDSKVFVRESAALTLAQNPDVRSVVPLVRLLMHRDARLRGAVLTALWRITGKRFTKQSQWQEWLKGSGPYPETNCDPTAAPPAPASFLDIGLWSKSVIYLVDASPSMRQADKIKAAKELIGQSIRQLPKETRFNVMFFGSSIRAFSQTTFPRADRHNKAKALGWLDKVRLPERGKTNFYNALSRVLRSRTDDVIVISDGVPTEGRYVYPSKLVRQIADENLQQKTRIHTVGFYTLLPRNEGPNPTPVGPSVDFLRDLAARNHGEFRYRWFNVNTRGK